MIDTRPYSAHDFLIFRRSNEPPGELLRNLRESTRKSQRTVAREMHLDPTYINRIESGARPIPLHIPFYEGIKRILNAGEEDMSRLTRTDESPRFLFPDPEQQETDIEFGNLLREYQYQVDMDGFELSKETGLDKSYLARVKRGVRPPPRDNDFYDILPNKLRLSPKKYADLLLTSKPPRWLVPNIYLASEGMIAESVIERLRGHQFEIDYYIDPSQYSPADLVDLSRIVGGAFNLQLSGKAPYFDELMEKSGVHGIFATKS